MPPGWPQPLSNWPPHPATAVCSTQQLVWALYKVRPDCVTQNKICTPYPGWPDPLLFFWAPHSLPFHPLLIVFQLLLLSCCSSNAVNTFLPRDLCTSSSVSLKWLSPPKCRTCSLNSHASLLNVTSSEGLPWQILNKIWTHIRAYAFYHKLSLFSLALFFFLALSTTGTWCIGLAKKFVRLMNTFNKVLGENEKCLIFT